MTITETPLKGLLVLNPQVFEDDRGYFFESFRKSELEQFHIDHDFVQDNESKSNKGVLRGLHMQAPPFAQAKLLRVVKGAIYDVAVDIRKDSSTYGEYFGIELNEENKTNLYVPAGFAHGFACLRDNTIVQYKCSSYYNKSAELGIAWNDPKLKIDWQIENPVISSKDKEHPFLEDFISPF